MKTLTLKNETIYTGDLILVNRDYRYHEKKQIPLSEIPENHGSVLLHHRAARALSLLMNAVSGWQGIVATSGWRPFSEQQRLWSDSLKENGRHFTETYVAVPGHSEHQTGLAVDLALKQPLIDPIRPHFPYEGICQLFREKAPQFGFIERYPDGRESITGIGHEPWHFRYVGIAHARIITKNRLTLEEYIEQIKTYPFGKRGLSYQGNGRHFTVSYQKASASGTTILETEDNVCCSVSGNNSDGFIITEWKQTEKA